MLRPLLPLLLMLGTACSASTEAAAPAPAGSGEDTATICQVLGSEEDPALAALPLPEECLEPPASPGICPEGSATPLNPHDLSGIVDQLRTCIPPGATQEEIEQILGRLDRNVEPPARPGPPG